VLGTDVIRSCPAQCSLSPPLKGAAGRKVKFVSGHALDDRSIWGYSSPTLYVFGERCSAHPLSILSHVKANAAQDRDAPLAPGDEGEVSVPTKAARTQGHGIDGVEGSAARVCPAKTTFDQRPLPAKSGHPAVLRYAKAKLHPSPPVASAD